MARRIYVYRVIVDKLEEPDIERWREDMEDYYGEAFKWPRRRHFLSERAAIDAAGRFNRYGAIARVVRSEQVEFEDEDQYLPLPPPKPSRRERAIAELLEIASS